MSQNTIIWYKRHVSDLRNLMELLEFTKMDSAIVDITNPLVKWDFSDESHMLKQAAEHSKSDLVLSSKEWLNKIILKLSDDLELDSENERIRKESEKMLDEELNRAEYLVQCGYILLKLRSGKTANLARHIQKTTKCIVLTEVPMKDDRISSMARRKDNDLEEFVPEDMWQRWHDFSSQIDMPHRLRLALTLTEDIPTEDEIARWCGEPIDCIIIPEKLFILNAQNFPVLSKNHQMVLQKFIEYRVHFILKADGTEFQMQHYVEYLHHLVQEKFATSDPMEGFDDLLQIPLQPLYDNLDCYTYEVFEKDPVKYSLYQSAIEAALNDRVPEEEKETKEQIVMIVGAGRGPLVRATINASKNTQRKIKIYIVEKNPTAIITLNALKNEIWDDMDITIFAKDMRELELPQKVDIIVSELLGSFGDNELSPECLDCAQKHLRDDGISIPSNSISYINPVMSFKLHNAVRMLDRSQRNKIMSVASNYECLYVVYPKNVYHISEPQKLFTFEHPNRDAKIDNSRYSSLDFYPTQDCVLHGFIGYFESVLYKDIIMSIHPVTHTIGLSSWFSIYLPIAEPQEIRKGTKITANFWRCTSSHQVWYEWSVSSPQKSYIHNHLGKICPIYK